MQQNILEISTFCKIQDENYQILVFLTIFYVLEFHRLRFVVMSYPEIFDLEKGILIKLLKLDN